MAKKSNEQRLPRPNVRFRTSGETEEFTAEDIRGMVCNPVYAGMGPYPALIPDDQWVAAATVAIENEGPEQFLVNLLYVLRQTLGDGEE